MSTIKAFSSIPSPLKLPFLGHTYLFIPKIGPYTADRLTEAIKDLSLKYGSVFKLKLGGQTILITTDANDASILFQNEGKLPHRPTFPALLYYREKNFKSVGIVPGNGPEWYKFRSGANELLKIPMVNFYQDKHKEIAKNFVEHVKNNRKKNVLEDLFTHLLKYTIEAISIVSPGYHIKCLNEKDQKSQDLITASINFMDGLYSTLIGPPIWKFYPNKGYKQLESAHLYAKRLINEHLVKFKQLHMKDPERMREINPFLASLFSNKQLSWEDILILSLETFFGGIDATSTTLTMTMFYLSLDKKVQERARFEGRVYLRACVREALRMSPTAGANSRFIQKDCIIGGYFVPKGTLVSAFSSVTSTNEKYFENPNRYIPERWLRNNDKSTTKNHAFASLPFGHGARMCPGRRLALQEMEILLEEVLDNFFIQPTDVKKVCMIYRMNRVPDCTVNLQFIDRNK